MAEHNPETTLAHRTSRSVGEQYNPYVMWGSVTAGVGLLVITKAIHPWPPNSLLWESGQHPGPSALLAVGTLYAAHGARQYLERRGKPIGILGNEAVTVLGAVVAAGLANVGNELLEWAGGHDVLGHAMSVPQTIESSAQDILVGMTSAAVVIGVSALVTKAKRMNLAKETAA